MSRLIILFGAIWFCTIQCKTEILQCDRGDPNFTSECTIYNADYTEPTNFELQSGNLYKPIEKLIFSDSRVSYIPHGIFTELPYLTFIELSDCSMVEVRRSDFMNADHLISINLSHNNLTVLKDSIFTGANGVLGINLAYNKITLVNSRTFKNLYRLTELNLAHNQIKKISSNVFTNLNHLHYLCLSSNLIEIITADDLYTNRELREFDLSQNYIVSIDQKAFIKLEALTILNLEHNKLQKLNISEVVHVHTLLINSNNLTELQTNDEIRILHASNNQLTGTKLYIGTGIRRLSLANNSLKNINCLTPLSKFELDEYQPPNTVTKLTKLESILNAINTGGLILLADLEFLNLGGNHLTQLPIDDFKNILPKLKTIGIYDNNWMCSDLRVILEYFTEYKIELIFGRYVINTGIHIHGVQCNDPDTILPKLPQLTDNQILEINQTRIQLGTLQMENEQLKSDLNRVRVILDNIPDTTTLDAAVNANVLEICTGQITSLTEAHNVQLNSLSAQINMQNDQIQQISTSLNDQGYTNTIIIYIKNLLVALFAGYGIARVVYIN